MADQHATVGGRNNTRIVIVALLVTAALAALIYWFFPPDSHRWYNHAYAENGDWAEEPYSTKYLYEYLKTLREEGDFIEVDSTMDRNMWPYIDSAATNINYIVMGYGPWMDSATVENAFRFVEQGNSLFYFTEMPPRDIMEELNGGECQYYWPEHYNIYGENSDWIINDSAVFTNFEHPSLRREEDFEFVHQIKGHQAMYNWYILQDLFLCEENVTFTPLGKIGDKVTFYRVAYGDGFFYFHTNPKMFTNYYLVEKDGLDYTERAFAHLDEGAIIYDRKRWQRDYKNNPRNDSYNQQDGPLKYVLSQESLRWGIYVILAALGILLLFSFRRKQRIIPVIHPKENSSMEYVETITELYYQQGGQGRIFGHLTEQFLQFVRERYRLQTGDLGEEFEARLVNLSSVPEAHVKEVMITQRKGAHPPNVSSELLVTYYEALDRFYKECK